MNYFIYLSISLFLLLSLFLFWSNKKLLDYFSYSKGLLNTLIKILLILVFGLIYPIILIGLITVSIFMLIFY